MTTSSSGTSGKFDAIPPGLRDIAALADEWGKLSQGEQDERLTQLLRDDPEGALAMARSVVGCRAALRDWASELGFPDKDKADFSEADWQHPYWLFLSTLKVFEGVPGLDDDDPAVQDAVARMQAGNRKLQVADMRSKAAASFRRGDYAAAATLLASIEADLAPADKARLALARKKAGTD